MLCSLPAVAAMATRHVDPDTGLLSWKVEGQAFAIELIQVLPDYVRAVYAARGLPQQGRRLVVGADEDVDGRQVLPLA